MTTLLLLVYVAAALRQAWWLLEVGVYALGWLWGLALPYTSRPFG